ncbi:MAG: hypothetical protein M1826_004494 [Phylliscum demangeonii]|nr:MAG: hypothetical protein M1826_004494 [Phylliscum demangeonii]
MGQNISAPRESSTRRNEERLARARAERSRSRRHRDYVDGREGVGGRGIPASSRAPSQPHRMWDPRWRLSALPRPETIVIDVDGDYDMERPFSSLRDLGARTASAGAPTDADVDRARPSRAAATAPHDTPSSLSGIFRRGRRMMSSRGPVMATTDGPSSEEPSPAQGSVASRRSLLVDGQNTLRRSRNRLSTLLSHPTELPGLRHRRRNGPPSSGPAPVEPDPWAWDDPSSLDNSTDRMSFTATTTTTTTSTAPTTAPTDSVGRRSRLARVRDSVLPSAQSLFHRLSTPPMTMQAPDPTSSLTQAPTLPTGVENYLPRIPTPTIGLDLSRPRRSSPETRSGPPSNRDPPDVGVGRRTVRTDRRPGRTFNTEQYDLPPASQPNEDQAARLSRHLSVAATAIAASLVGNADRAFSEAQDVGADGADGSFDSFLAALQNGSLASALRNGGNESGTAGNGNEAGGTLTGDGIASPVNFFRIFRFGTGIGNIIGGATGADRPPSGGRRAGRAPAEPNSEPASPSPSSNVGGAGAAETGGAGRMVPVIIVGIRSVTPRTSTSTSPSVHDGIPGADNATSPLFDALSNLPLIMPPGLTTRGSGTLLRRGDRRSRFGRSRRASMSAVNASFPANYDSQRHHRYSSGGAAGSGASGRGVRPPPLDTSRPMPMPPMPPSLSESPPGPHPPPSTPAELHALSAGSSGTNSPSRRPSSASGGLVLPTAAHGTPTQTPPTAATSGSSPPEPSIDEIADARSAARRRRLSDGEFARYRDFGPGSSRRNGIVGDSEVDPGSAGSFTGPPAEGTRTWIIYVLGGSYPEDHPILTTPSLFTDSPTYEDMLLLSSILGPAKPPVASREEVAAAASGLFHIHISHAETDETGIFQPHEQFALSDRTGEQIVIPAGERCLICLCDYEMSEQLRQLQHCRHLFHQECIDEWLTTGRNSCPLCRGQGVGDVKSAGDGPGVGAAAGPRPGVGAGPPEMAAPLTTEARRRRMATSGTTGTTATTATAASSVSSLSSLTSVASSPGPSLRPTQPELDEEIMMMMPPVIGRGGRLGGGADADGDIVMAERAS